MKMTLAQLNALATRSAKFQLTTAVLSSTTNTAAMATPKTTLKAIAVASWTSRPFASKVKRAGGYKADDPEDVSTLELDLGEVRDFLPGSLATMEDATVECLLPSGVLPVSGSGFRGARVIRKNDEGKYDVDYFVATVSQASVVGEIDVEGKKVTRVSYTLKPLSVVEQDTALAADPSIEVQGG